VSPLLAHGEPALLGPLHAGDMETPRSQAHGSIVASIPLFPTAKLRSAIRKAEQGGTDIEESEGDEGGGNGELGFD
jgi:hypothetical protein